MHLGGKIRRVRKPHRRPGYPFPYNHGFKSRPKTHQSRQTTQPKLESQPAICRRQESQGIYRRQAGCASPRYVGVRKLRIFQSHKVDTDKIRKAACFKNIEPTSTGSMRKNSCRSANPLTRWPVGPLARWPTVYYASLKYVNVIFCVFCVFVICILPQTPHLSRNPLCPYGNTLMHLDSADLRKNDRPFY